VTTAPDRDRAAPAHRIGRHCAAQQSLVHRIRMKPGDGLTSEPSRLGPFMSPLPRLEIGGRFQADPVVSLGV
jgi:hypothetical protein